MAELVKVSTEEMRDTVSRYITAKASLKEAYEWMDRALKTLDTCWKGAAYMAMKAQWDITYKNIQLSEAKMQDAIDELNKTADLFDANELAAISSFKSLDVGTSPFQ